MEMGKERKARNLVSLARRPSAAGTNGGGDGAAYLYEHRGLARDPAEYFARGQIFTTFEPVIFVIFVT